jgi:tetratricopeptide (TPR) repeat protein
MQMRRVATIVVMAALAVGAAAQATGSKSEDEIKAEDLKAQALYDQQNFVGALPLYEDLHAQRPTSLAYTERLAFALVANTSQQTPAEAKASRARARKLLLAAKAAGDNSGLLQILLEKLPAEEEATEAPKEPGQELVDQGEVAFTKGDMPAALALYEKALEVNPQLYGAALFAGDAEFKMNHPAEAGKWFARAIAISPDSETAYRYWGDTLEKAGEHQRAEQEFIAAIVAQPYQRAPRVGLKQWADKNHAMVVAPPIKLPKRAEPDAKGNTQINLDMSTMMSPAGSAWLVYMIAPTVWQKTEFAKHYPNETKYRHSLAEEAESLRGMLAVIKEKKIDVKGDPTLKLLAELDKNEMLECWILLDDPDQGIAQDYVAYRKDHHELLAKYIAQYDVHAM